MLVYVVYNMTEKNALRFLLIADDLTGALDSSVPFAGEGRRVAVARHLGAVRELAGADTDVLAVNLGTRDGSEAAARARIAELCEIVDPAEFDLVFKKVDSRLKGHVGAELAVLFNRMGEPECVAVPAIPSMGRVQIGGRIEGEGIGEPIPVSPLFDGPIEVPDVLADADIDKIAASRTGVLWVGARGLALALARVHVRSKPAMKPNAPVPLLMAIGSRDPITRAQVDALRDIPVHDAPDGNLEHATLSAPVEVVRMTAGGARLGANVAGDAFAEGIAALSEAYRPGTLLCSGGETANAVLACLGIDTIEVLAETAPGVPVCEVAAPWGSLRLITKSGGFGAPDTLVQIAARSCADITGENVR